MTGRKRLTPAEREQMIVDGAIRFFAEVGFDGQTRELARRLGVTQPLLYRYFPSKEHLIERVYEAVYLRRWNVEWERRIVDRERPLEQRLIEFYQAYARAIFNYEWLRIFIFAGLKGVNINRRYLRIIRERLLKPICGEVRAEAGLPPPERIPITSEELEMVWSLHGGFFYMAMRKWIYNVAMTQDLDGAIAREVRMFVRGAPSVFADILAAPEPAGPS